MEVKRPVEPNPATACRRREPSAGDARRDGYRNTRIERRHGCVIGTTAAFLERSGPDSTVDGASVDIWNKRVGLMSILLTLFRSNVCWAKPNHAFFYCQHSFAFFFQPAIAMQRVDVIQTRRAMACAHRRCLHSFNSVFRKALLFCCFFKATHKRSSWTGATAAPGSARWRWCASPVRQLKIFYPTTALPASHQHKCANLLRRSIALRSPCMHPHGRLDACMCALHRVERSTIDAYKRQVFFTKRTPHPHDWLTSEIRRVCRRTPLDDAAVLRAWQMRCFSMPAKRGDGDRHSACTPRSATRQRRSALVTAARQQRTASTWRAKKMAAPGAAIRFAAARRGQCASSSSSSA